MLMAGGVGWGFRYRGRMELHRAFYTTDFHGESLQESWLNCKQGVLTPTQSVQVQSEYFSHDESHVLSSLTMLFIHRALGCYNQPKQAKEQFVHAISIPQFKIECKLKPPIGPRIA